MLYYYSMELHYCKESPKKKKNVTQVQVQILCKFCASIFPCFTLFFQKLFRISHKKRSFSRFKPDFSRYFGYFPVPFGVGVVEAAGSSPVTQTKKSPTSTCLSDFFVALQHSKLYEVITKVITKTNCIHLFSYVLICNEGESLSDPHLFLKF